MNDTDDLGVRVERTAALLRLAVREDPKQPVLTGDDRVDVQTAARLLRVAPATLETWRKSHQGPAHYARGWGTVRVTYRLQDLAAFIESGRFENGEMPDGMGMEPG